MLYLLEIERNGHYSENTALIARLIDERNWLNGAYKYKTFSCHLEDIDKLTIKDNLIVPVGCVDFVVDVLYHFYNKITVRPQNIPKVLNTQYYLKRKVCFLNSVQDINNMFKQWNTDKLFIKSNSIIKNNYSDVFIKGDMIPGDSSYFVSENVDFISEWRAFVFRGRLYALKNYKGDVWSLPDKDFVFDCINQLGNNMSAYILDIGVLKSSETAVIGVHDFFACDLCGFKNPAILAMLQFGVRDLLKNRNI